MAPRNKETITEYVIPNPSSDVHDFYRNFAAAIDGKEEQLIKHVESRKVLAVMEACFKSAETGKPVEFTFDN
jgi:predicted dehydrogenase